MGTAAEKAEPNRISGENRLANRKRLLLSEVYVHKYAKHDEDATEDSRYDVFHIFELDDSDTKIIPKLSTNCSEPGKVIEVLQNFTGSETPQLQRLINKLCSQNKSLIGHQTRIEGKKDKQRDNGLESTNNSCAASTDSKTKTAPKAPIIRVKPIENLVSTSNVSENVEPQHQSKALSVMDTNTCAAAPVKLWNNIIQPTNSNQNEALEVLVVKSTESTTKDGAVYSLRTNEIDSASPNESNLKIDQVFEGVNQDFVDNLLSDKCEEGNKLPETLIQVSTNPRQGRAPLPSTDINKPLNGSKAQKNTMFSVQAIDLRCNLCLKISDTIDAYKDHMNQVHGHAFVCRFCHEPFGSRSMYDAHCYWKACAGNPNASRPYICIVDPPIILLKENKVHAFKCKHCKIAFFDQKSYVKHAQKHATRFRCKRCTPGKTMTADEMKLHLASTVHRTMNI